MATVFKKDDLAESVKKPHPNYKPRWSDKLIAPVGELIKYPLCYSAGIPCFIYAFLEFRYSPEKREYVFAENSESNQGKDMSEAADGFKKPSNNVTY